MMRAVSDILLRLTSKAAMNSRLPTTVTGMADATIRPVRTPTGHQINFMMLFMNMRNQPETLGPDRVAMAVDAADHHDLPAGVAGAARHGEPMQAEEPVLGHEVEDDGPRRGVGSHCGARKTRVHQPSRMIRRSRRSPRAR